MHFSDRLAAIIKKKDSCLMLGLDPNWDLIPDNFKEGYTLAKKAEVYEKFCLERLHQCQKYVCGVKIQMAYFEALGSVGIKAVENIIAHIRDHDEDLIIMMDAKRGDIGATSEAYASSLLSGESPLGGDCVTVNPYMGSDSVVPFISSWLAPRPSKALFVLVRTSNPSAAEFQPQIFKDVSAKIEEWGQTTREVRRETSNLQNQSGDIFEYERGNFEVEKMHKWSRVGAVVGATNQKELLECRELMPHTWILAPGVGAQGGNMDDVMAIRDEDGLGVLIPISRAVLYAEDSAATVKEYWEAQRLG